MLMKRAVKNDQLKVVVNDDNSRSYILTLIDITMLELSASLVR